MDCRDVRNLLYPYADGELDLVRNLQIEHHLVECAECAEQLLAFQRLRTAIAEGSLYQRAPASLREKVRAALVPATPATAAPPSRKRRSTAMFAATAAGIALLAGACLTAGILWSNFGTATETRVAENVVAGHIRSLQAEHLKDVASSNRHILKPWFQGKLDFSPQVPDLAAHGYPASGGRLDYLSDRPVAAIVYTRRQHVINLFTWPLGENEERSVKSLHRQGFHLRYWHHGGMAYWAISDLNPQELDEFARLFQEAVATPRP